MWILISVVSIALGALVAFMAEFSPLRPAVLGVVAMVAAAMAARRHWGGAQGAGPGSPERALWVGLGTSSMVLGHLLTALCLIGPDLQLHTPAGHALGTDSWTLVAGGAIAWWIARDRRPRRDERDQAIDTRGLRWSYGTMMLLLLANVVLLGFGADWQWSVSAPFAAHLLIAAMLASVAVGQAVRLAIYRRDALE